MAPLGRRLILSRSCLSSKYTGNFKRVAKKKEPSLQLAVARCVELLGDNPHHPGLYTQRVQGAPGVWEGAIRDSANCVTFHWNGDRIVLRITCNHDILRRRHVFVAANPIPK
jgi:hypothetical protein